MHKEFEYWQEARTESYPNFAGLLNITSFCHDIILLGINLRQSEFWFVGLVLHFPAAKHFSNTQTEFLI